MSETPDGMEVARRPHKKARLTGSYMDELDVVTPLETSDGRISRSQHADSAHERTSRAKTVKGFAHSHESLLTSTTIRTRKRRRSQISRASNVVGFRDLPLEIIEEVSVYMSVHFLDLCTG